MGLYKSGEFSCTGEFFCDEIVLIWQCNFSTCLSDSTNCSSKLEIYFSLSRTSFLAWYSWFFRLEILDLNSIISSSEAFSKHSISLLRLWISCSHRSYSCSSFLILPVCWLLLSISDVMLFEDNSYHPPIWLYVLHMFFSTSDEASEMPFFFVIIKENRYEPTPNFDRPWWGSENWKKYHIAWNILSPDWLSFQP